MSLLEIPDECYTITAFGKDSRKYKVYKDDEYIEDVYAIVRYSDWKKADINWRKEIEGE